MSWRQEDTTPNLPGLRMAMVTVLISGLCYLAFHFF